jgi:hypothetical protein
MTKKSFTSAEEDAIYHGEHIRFSNPIKPGEMEEAYAKGMVRRSDLVDREYYRGHCRNASCAQWFADHGVFVYMRHKFGTHFPETIFHPENDDGFDLFIPAGVEEQPSDHQIVKIEDEARFFSQYKHGK